MFPKSQDIYYMYGKYPVLAALNNPNRQIVKVFCTEKIFQEHQTLIARHDYEIVKVDKLKTLVHSSEVNPQNIVAKLSSIFSYDLSKEIIGKVNSRVAILDQITDPQNIGSIIRNASAFKIDAIIMPSDNTPNETASLAKAACGALELVPIIKVTNLVKTINYLKQQAFWVYGFDSHATEKSMRDTQSEKMVFIFGSEDKGMRRLVKENCDYLVKIPISDKVESLNVASATAIIFYLSSI